MKLLPRTIVVLPLAVDLCACGGGGGYGGSPSATNQSPGGIWTVQYVQGSGPTAGDTMDAKALVTETGDVYFAVVNTVNGCTERGFGNVTVNGSALSGSLSNAMVTWSANAAVNTSCKYPDGSTSGTTTLSGTVTQRSSLTVTDTLTTSAGTSGTATHTWSYSGLYSEMPSLATIAGNYTDGSNTLTVNSNGAIFEQDPTTGCVLNGQASIVNSSYNAYALSFSYASCTGTAAVLNGQTGTGFGYYDDSVSPNQFVYGVHLTVNGQITVIAGALVK
jgi:hypothetical protein